MKAAEAGTVYVMRRYDSTVLLLQRYVGVAAAESLFGSIKLRMRLGVSTMDGPTRELTTRGA